jgi:hypothetical protein
MAYFHVHCSVGAPGWAHLPNEKACGLFETAAVIGLKAAQSRVPTKESQPHSVRTKKPENASTGCSLPKWRSHFVWQRGGRSPTGCQRHPKVTGKIKIALGTPPAVCKFRHRSNHDPVLTFSLRHRRHFVYEGHGDGLSH